MILNEKYIPREKCTINGTTITNSGKHTGLEIWKKAFLQFQGIRYKLQIYSNFS